MNLKHVVESQQFTVPLLMELFERTRLMERVVARGGTLDYQNRILASVFYQPSTRTRFSLRLPCIGWAAACFPPSMRALFLRKSKPSRSRIPIRIIGSYSDVIVIRHHEPGGAARAARVSPVPVINAGDGDGGQHPTQALLDLYTIFRERPLDGLSVAFIGELDRGRTARSLAYLLAKFERVKIFFVSPPELQMKSDILQYLDRHGVKYEMESDIDRVVGEVDVVYQTRIRPDRLPHLSRQHRYAINSSVLERMRPDAMILHPCHERSSWTRRSTMTRARCTSARPRTGCSCGWRC